MYLPYTSYSHPTVEVNITGYHIPMHTDISMLLRNIFPPATGLFIVCTNAYFWLGIILAAHAVAATPYNIAWTVLSTINAVIVNNFFVAKRTRYMGPPIRDKDALNPICNPNTHNIFYILMQVLGILGAIPLGLHHLGYFPHYDIALTCYIVMSALIGACPIIARYRIHTNEQFDDIFQQLSAHAQVETIRQIGHKTSQNIHISYTQKQKFIEHHKAKTITGYISTI